MKRTVQKYQSLSDTDFKYLLTRAKNTYANYDIVGWSCSKAVWTITLRRKEVT